MKQLRRIVIEMNRVLNYIKYLLHFAEKTFLIKLMTVTLQYLTGGRVLEHFSIGLTRALPF